MTDQPKPTLAEVRQNIYLVNRLSPILSLATMPTINKIQKELLLVNRKHNRIWLYAELVLGCAPAFSVASKSNDFIVSLHNSKLSKKEVMAVLKFLT